MKFYLHTAVCKGHCVVCQGITGETLEFAVLRRHRSIRDMIWIKSTIFPATINKINVMMKEWPENTISYDYQYMGQELAVK